MIWLAVGLAVLNACCFAAGARLQHSAGPSAGPERLTAAVRRPCWLAGLALLAAGAVLQVGAMRLAPVTVVQPARVLGIAGCASGGPRSWVVSALPSVPSAGHVGGRGGPSLGRRLLLAAVRYEGLEGPEGSVR